MAFIGTRRNGLSFLCRSKKQVKKQLAPSSSTYSAKEDDNAYLVRRWISLLFLSCYIRLIFSPLLIILSFLLFWVCFVVCSFVCIGVYVRVGNAGTMFRNFQ